MTPQVTLALSRISRVAEDLEALGSDWLSASELTRLERIRSERRRREFLAGRLALRRTLSSVYGGDVFRDWSIDAPEEAPPRLSSPFPSSEIRLGLSHSADWLLCAVANVPVGVDIERVRDDRDYPALIQEVCSPKEQQRLRTNSNDTVPAQFTALWALKEAWLKSRAEGVELGRLSKIETQLRPTTFEANAMLWQMNDMVIALCLPAGAVKDISYSVCGAISGRKPVCWCIQQVAGDRCVPFPLNDGGVASK